jgi:SAM-dependent methyltransferase
MPKLLNRALAWAAAFGVEPVRAVRAIRGLPAFISEYRRLMRENRAADRPWPIRLSAPYLADRYDDGGTASGHYFHQDLLVARRIYEINPERHVDVGSRVDGFVAHVAVFREIEVFDIRAVKHEVRNIRFRQMDIMAPADKLDTADSVSCLHALEHFGLGRYGDTVDLDGFRKGFEVLSAMVRPGGTLYLSLPIGNERIDFNGNRVFSLQRVRELYEADFTLRRFSYVDDAGDLHEDVPFTGNELNLNYGCGIFELEKIPPSRNENRQTR